jgi:hypothetical protein
MRPLYLEGSTARKKRSREPIVPTAAPTIVRGSSYVGLAHPVAVGSRVRFRERTPVRALERCMGKEIRR